ncbi:hypothetical protein [Streptomyces sp. TLI_146]|uniref:hypothetical protein n=1 Tax=Streptomyces sp. TLI_146 TaxID=1938858 RepID=UPI000C7082AD|nr:hypothetical protein [Streptomyces sp. TLI_146]PKV77021.1 hypothetical protein BX283_7945 [Streptomyces sp. TLI_146]
MPTRPTIPSATGNHLEAAEIEDAPNHRPIDPARYRPCEVCHEPGADTPTHIFVADSGASHTSYAHRGCAEASGPAGVITP